MRIKSDYESAEMRTDGQMDVDNDDNATMEDAMRGGTKCKGSVEEAC